MSIDTKLYLNTRWQLDDIIKVIERIRDCKVEITSNHSFAPGYFCFNLNNSRMMHVHTQNQTPLGSATLLSMSADDESHSLFKSIADCLGGIFVDNDYDDKCEMINGKLWDEHALAYFLKNAIIRDGINEDDITGLLKSTGDWYDRIEPHVKPEILNVLLRRTE